MATSNKKIMVSFSMEKDDKAVLEELAKQDERSVSFIINKAIKQYILDAKSKEDDTSSISTHM